MAEELNTEVNTESKKLISFEELAKHNTAEDCWLLVHGKVYDVTRYLEEHPGGDDVMISSSGKDATEDFEDVGHSAAARKELEKYYIGEYDASSAPEKPVETSAAASAAGASSKSGSILTTFLRVLVPVAILALAITVRYWTKKDLSPGDGLGSTPNGVESL